MKRGCKHAYELGPATVFVGTSGGGAVVMDGMIRVTFNTEVHPADGTEVVKRDVLAFYPWDAANIALKLWKEGRA